MNNVTDLLKNQSLSEINSYSFSLYTLPIIIVAFLAILARIIHIILEGEGKIVFFLSISIIPDLTYCFSFVCKNITPKYGINHFFDTRNPI